MRLARWLDLRTAPRCDAVERSNIGRGDQRERLGTGGVRAAAAKILNSSCPEAETARRAERLVSHRAMVDDLV